jgi:transposase-like protein
MFNTTDNLPHHIPIQTADEPAPRVAQRWQCPDCHNGITLHVRVRHAPVCNNKAAHSRRHVEMKREKKSSPR